ncbi:hypothetical protein GCM10010211_28950 [Streptomyces albospinus]|uniref:Uncharacterized protein n=1 Tax=Streptomyces albospinus TaxID=285515 RepID=A0ABQ2V2J1_9ACTN|nr:hypothetical protein GCM10010211_28950 [Streptomyces albospinus]
MRVRNVIAAMAITGAAVLGVVGSASAVEGARAATGRTVERSILRPTDDGADVNVPGYGPMHGTLTQTVDSDG